MRDWIEFLSGLLLLFGSLWGGSFLCTLTPEWTHFPIGVTSIPIFLLGLWWALDGSDKLTRK